MSIIKEEAYFGLGLAYQSKKNDCKALASFVRALSYDISAFSENSYQVARDCSGLGNFYLEKTDLVRSYSYLNQAVCVGRHFYGVNHPQMHKMIQKTRKDCALARKT